MEANNKVGLFINKNLHVAGPLSFVRDLVVAPFKRLELSVVGRDVISAMNFFGVIFSQTNRPVFYGSKHSCWHVCIVHQLGAILEQSLSKQLTSFDCCRSQLESTILNISDCVNVRHVGLLMVVDFEFTIFEGLESSGCQVEAFGDSVSANCKDDCVKLITDFLFVFCYQMGSNSTIC